MTLADNNVSWMQSIISRILHKENDVLGDVTNHGRNNNERKEEIEPLGKHKLGGNRQYPG